MSARMKVSKDTERCDVLRSILSVHDIPDCHVATLRRVGTAVNVLPGVKTGSNFVLFFSKICSVFPVLYFYFLAFNALTLLVGHREWHRACKKLSGGLLAGMVICMERGADRLAYGPADATATQCLLLQENPDWFYLSGTG